MDRPYTWRKNATGNRHGKSSPSFLVSIPLGKNGLMFHGENVVGCFALKIPFGQEVQLLDAKFGPFK